LRLAESLAGFSAAGIMLFRHAYPCHDRYFAVGFQLFLRKHSVRNVRGGGAALLAVMAEAEEASIALFAI
jgi:hypothetical protein